MLAVIILIVQQNYWDNKASQSIDLFHLLQWCERIFINNELFAVYFLYACGGGECGGVCGCVIDFLF